MAEEIEKEPGDEAALDDIADDVAEDLEDVAEEKEPEGEEDELEDDLDEPKEKASAKGGKKPQSVPYKRFQKELKRRKEAYKQLQTLQASSKGSQEYKNFYTSLLGVIGPQSQHSFLGKFLTSLLQKGSNPDWKGFAAEVGKLAEKNPAAAAKVIEGLPSELSQKIEADQASLKEEIQTMRYQNYFQAVLPQIPEAIKKDARFKGVMVDKEFMEDLKNMIPDEVARLEKEGLDASRPNILNLARRLAMKEQRRADRILGSQAKGIRSSKGAALMDSKGPAGTKKSKVPDAFSDPDAFERYLLKNITV